MVQMKIKINNFSNLLGVYTLVIREKEYNLDNFDEILLDTEKPGWKSNHLYVDNIYKYLESSNEWDKVYEKNFISLFKKFNY